MCDLADTYKNGCMGQWAPILLVLFVCHCHHCVKDTVGIHKLVIAVVIVIIIVVVVVVVVVFIAVAILLCGLLHCFAG